MTSVGVLDNRPPEHPIWHAPGTDFKDVRWTWKQFGSIVDLTGDTATLTIHAEETSVALVTLTSGAGKLTLVTGASSNITANADAADFSAITARGKYFWKLVLSGTHNEVLAFGDWFEGLDSID